LPVVWRSNKKAWITAGLFESYFASELHHELKAYCERVKAPFKILLLLDNAPGHPHTLLILMRTLHSSCLPTPHLLSNLWIRVSCHFQELYLQKTFTQLVKDTDGEDRLSVKDFWRNFNIKKAINNIGDAWADVTQSCMNGVLRKIWPHVVTDFHGFEPEDEISNSRRAIIDMARSLGFEEAEEANVKELLQSHTEELSTEDLLELKKELSNEDYESSDVVPVKCLTTKQLVEFFKHIDIAKGIMDDNDANSERSAKVARRIESALACYKELYSERQKAARQLSLHHFFKRVESCQSTDSEPSTSAGEPAQSDLATPSPASPESSD
jgi:hypothetical protein